MTLAQSLLGFALVAAVMTVTPGLDTVLVLRQALRDRRSVAFATGAGISVGVLLWGMAAAAGLAALFVASEVAFTVLRLTGVGYLVWLAWGYFRAAFTGTPGLDLDDPGPVRTGVWEGFVRGLLTNLLNPKIAVFYLTVLPIFLPVGVPPVLGGVALAGVHAGLGLAWFVLVILGARAAGRLLRQRRWARVVDGAAGTALAGFAIALGLSKA
ncbi:MAG: LysE family translocator [Propionicimonas sp.]|nr:LysE family translocator [Propionicimonas sp.]